MYVCVCVCTQNKLQLICNAKCLFPRAADAAGSDFYAVVIFHDCLY